ncbi:hypothetical protein Golob_011507 [Gossypium lobatum]|uniref:Uncharacterized protein n=1 Tax=Gossypium lobatum TaxID=34289 RepID=A0A7J8MQ33_9ROSI|nr:hypothetical protein [Gossypium lobatum]
MRDAGFLHEAFMGKGRKLDSTLFKWMLYSNPRIQECIPSKFLVNPNIWHVKVPLVVYVMVEMHELERVLWKFRFRHMIPLTPQDIEDLHHIVVNM